MERDHEINRAGLGAPDFDINALVVALSLKERDLATALCNIEESIDKEEGKQMTNGHFRDAIAVIASRDYIQFYFYHLKGGPSLKAQIAIKIWNCLLWFIRHR